MLSIFRNNSAGARAASLVRVGSASWKSNQLRHASNPCAPEKTEATCGNKILKEYPCNVAQEQFEHKTPQAKPDFKSMWTVDGCDTELCILPLRYDMKYYRISDKQKRDYQVTWNECPRLLIKPKKVCIREGMKRPEIKRRQRPPAVEGQVAKPPDPADCGKGASKTKCVYVVNPCCKVGRRPATCEVARYKTDCTKRKAPYPSFSECDKEPLNEAPNIECKCLDLPALCDAWIVLRRRLAMGWPPAKKCGDA